LEQKRTCGPLPFGDIGAPFLPVLCAIAVLLEPPLLLGEVLVVIENDHGELAKDDGIRTLVRCRFGDRIDRCGKGLASSTPQQEEVE
jgi:hypothetical protein